MTSIASISPGYPVLFEAYRWIRRNLEATTAIVVFAAVSYDPAFIMEKFGSGAWNIDAFYSALFNWSSIQSAFLFSIYAFFLSRSEPFIQAIAKTTPFRQLRRYVLRALWLSMALTLVTLPFAIAVPSIAVGPVTQPAFLLFWGLSTLLAYTFMSFVKVIRVFRKLERIQD